MILSSVYAYEQHKTLQKSYERPNTLIDTCGPLRSPDHGSHLTFDGPLRRLVVPLPTPYNGEPNNSSITEKKTRITATNKQTNIHLCNKCVYHNDEMPR